MIRIVNIILTLGVLAAGYFLYRTIQEPISFNAEYERRNEEVKDKLKYIRDLQLAYEDVNNSFAGSFDSLAHFVKNDSLTIMRIIGDPDELDAQGNPVPVKREFIKIPVKDTLTNPKWPLESLAGIPGVEGEEFSISASSVKRGRINVPVFEIIATYPQMLKGMNDKYIDPLSVRKVGSMSEPNYNGNWED